MPKQTPKQINVRVPDLVYNRLMAYVQEQGVSQKQAIVDAINRLTNAESDPIRQELQELSKRVQLLEQRAG